MNGTDVFMVRLCYFLDPGPQANCQYILERKSRGNPGSLTQLKVTPRTEGIGGSGPPGAWGQPRCRSTGMCGLSRADKWTPGASQ